MNNLKQNAQTAVKWSAILTFGNQCVSFLISVILARLLTPSDYGLVGTISIFIEISGIFVTGGLSIASFFCALPAFYITENPFFILAMSSCIYITIFILLSLFFRFQEIYDLKNMVLNK